MRPESTQLLPWPLPSEMSISNGTDKGLKCESSPNVETHICARCTQEIHERYFLKMDDLTWHTRCLKCSVCRIPLHQHTSCYVKNQEIFCKMDYNSAFGIKCAWCGHHISATDWIRRAKDYTYHLACFSCFSCKRQLSTGEEFGLVDSRVMCRMHYDIVVENITAGHGFGLEGAMPSNCLSLPSKRTRTSFSSEQLQVLQTQFTQESNPDVQTLQRLAEMTGLSRRVIQVWFQNSRARHRRHPGVTLDEPHRSPFSKPETVQLGVMQVCNESYPLTATQGLAMMVPHSPFSYAQYSLHVGPTQME